MLISKFKNLFNKKHRIIKNIGKNNIIEIDDDISCNVKVVGDGNSIRIRNNSNIKNSNECKSKFVINIFGNKNCINIDDINNNGGELNIDIGNYTGCNDVKIDIGKHLVFGSVYILAYQHNVPIKIGEDCLMSNGIVIRSGELPHIIYDTTDKRDLDRSEGIFIGDHVWVGQNVFIMKNVSIPNNAIIGSCSVVTKRFSNENVVIAGNPAKICREHVNWALTEDDIK